MVWLCLVIKTLWDNVTSFLEVFLNHTVTRDPLPGLLDYTLQGFWTKFHKRLLTIVCMTAKGLIAQNWKCADSLDRDQWLRSC